MRNCGKLVFLALILTRCAFAATPIQLLNVSYDPTRELYQQYNKMFATYWQQKTGQEIHINQSHGGSGAQARAVIDGLGADVVTLALGYDIDFIAQKTKLIPLDWQKSFPNNSSPYTSTIVFLVKKGNPKQIKDWSDLIRPDLQVITANPKTSGLGRWAYMAAWGYAYKKNAGNEAYAKDYVTKLYRNVPILDISARATTNSFIQREIGDVLLTWENEAHLALEKFGQGKYEIVTPSLSILTELPVAVVIGNTQKHGTTEVANAYLNYLYTPDSQNLIARFFYRPRDPMIAARFSNLFPKLPLFTIADFGGWQAVQKKHFDNGGIFDQIYQGDR